jgi:glycosyltransferase involved in cell wall biosynthesis
MALVADAASHNVQDWVRGLTGAGAEVEVVSFVDDPSGELRTHRLISPRWIGGKGRYLTAGPSARRLIEQIDPQLVVGFYVTGYGTVARLSRRRPVVQVSVGNDTLVNPPGRPAHLLARRNLGAADLVVAWGPHIVGAVQGFGVPAERILPLWAGIPLDPYPVDRVPSGDPLRLVTTRGLDPYYRHDVLLRAVAQARSRSLAARLTFIGSGPIAAQLEALADHLGVGGQVVFCGRVGEPEKVDRLYDNAVYVSACPTDGVSASLLEAMAAGLFPVVVDHEANRYWVQDGVNGLLVDGTPAGYVAALARLVDEPDLLSRARAGNRQIVAERADLGANSIRFVDAFDALTREV